MVLRITSSVVHFGAIRPEDSAVLWFSPSVKNSDGAPRGSVRENPGPLRLHVAQTAPHDNISVECNNVKFTRMACLVDSINVHSFKTFLKAKSGFLPDKVVCQKISV